MNLTTIRESLRRWSVALIACLAVGALLSVHMGQDASWDLRNYHLYNAWAWLTGRGARDVAAASLQSYFNPAPDLPYFLLLTGPLQHAPRWLAAFQGLWYGLLVFCISRIASEVARLQRRPFGILDGLAVLIGASGTMAVSQAGLSSNEVATACLVLAGIAGLLHVLDRPDAPPLGSLLLAGLCSGLAAGLKPTAIGYPVAAGLAALLTLRPWTQAVKSFAALAAGSTAGFLLAYGWWGWHLYQTTGNPVFPMFNQVFHSPWAPPGSMTDQRFLPRDWGQWIAYPFYWLRRNQSLVTEVPFADPRYALTLVALLALGLGHLLRRRQPYDHRPAVAVAYLAVFWAIGYLLWLRLFSILRYAVPLEALSGVLLLGTAHHLWPAPADGRTRRVAAYAAWGSLLVCLGLTHYPRWGHVPYTERTVELDAPRLPDHSLVILLGAPLAYLPPLLPQGTDLRYVGVNGFTQTTRGYRLYEQTAEAIQAHRGPRFVLRNPAASSTDDSLLATLLPGSHEDECRAVTSSLERDRKGRPPARPIMLCRVVMPGESSAGN